MRTTTVIFYAIIIFLIAGIFLYINPFGFLGDIDKRIPLVFVGFALVATIVLMLIRNPDTQKVAVDIRQADICAKTFIAEKFQDYNPTLINADLRNDDRKKLVYLLEYELHSGTILSLHVDLETLSVTRIHKNLASTPLQEPRRPGDQMPMRLTPS